MATWARGVDFKNSNNSKRVGGVGVYGTDSAAQKVYLGIGAEPWNNQGLELTSTTMKFKGKDVSLSDHTHSGYATTTHVHDDLSTSSKKILSLRQHSSSESQGHINPFYFALRQGKRLYTDEEFKDGFNSISRYNNSGNTGVVLERVTLANAPNKSGYVIRLTHDGTAASPGFGGFIQTINSRANATFAQVFKAKIPAGYKIATAANSLGDGGSDYLATDDRGTGRWETYIRITQCGYGGSFSSGGHVYLTGGPTPTATNKVVWYLASSTVYDLTDLQLTTTAAEVGAAPASHHHDSSYLKLTGGNLTGALTMPSSASASATNQPLQIGYNNGAMLSSYANVKIFANTDATTGADNEYVHLAAARGITPTTDQGLVVAGSYAKFNGQNLVVNNDSRLTNSRPANGGNSDTVDSLHASSFLRTDADSTLASGKTLCVVNGSKVVKTSNGGMSGGADAASSVDANLRLHSWYGIGFAPTIANQPVPQGENATWFNVRTGNAYTRGEWYAQTDKRVYHTGYKPTAGDVGALATTGGTLTGRLTANGKVSVPTTGSSWISGKTITNAAIGISTKQRTDAYHPVLAIESSSGHVVNIGGLGDDIGFYGYKSDRTANGTDWAFRFNASTGTTTSTAPLLLGGEIASGSSAKLQVKGFMRTGNIILHEGGNSPTSGEGVLENASGTLKWKGNTVYTTANKFTANDVLAIPVKKAHSSDWTSATTMSGKTYVGGYHSPDQVASFMSFGASGNANMDIMLDGEMYVSQGLNRVYHAGYKPSAADIGAATSNHNHTYNVNDPWLRDNGDNAHVKLFGNTRQMAFRTDGTTEYASGIGGYPFVWTYGGDSSGNRLMILNTSGDLWLKKKGNWIGTLLDEKAASSHNHDTSYSNKNGRRDIYKRITVNGNANTYYPVLINAGQTGFSYGRIDISRAYNWTAPDSWNTATHKGALTLSVRWTGDSSWGGNYKTIQVEAFNEGYNPTVAGLAHATTGLVVWLRGGGAVYQIESENGLAVGVTIYLDGFSDGNNTQYSARTNTNNVNGEIMNRWTTRGNSLYDNGNRVYSASNKPSTSDIGAFPAGGGYINGRSRVVASAGSAWSEAQFIVESSSTNGLAKLTWHSPSRTAPSIQAGDEADVLTAKLERSGVWKTSNANGFLKIGPMNTSHCHYETDRANHWFNKEIQVNGDIRIYNTSYARMGFSEGHTYLSDNNNNWLRLRGNGYMTYAGMHVPVLSWGTGGPNNGDGRPDGSIYIQY